jgi:hypothetical protein
LLSFLFQLRFFSGAENKKKKNKKKKNKKKKNKKGVFSNGEIHTFTKEYFKLELLLWLTGIYNCCRSCFCCDSFWGHWNKKSQRSMFSTGEISSNLLGFPHLLFGGFRVVCISLNSSTQFSRHRTISKIK